MSKEGIVQLRNYLGANDSSVLEPLFIAQYLFCPVNTIVNKSLLDWMMERDMPKAKLGSHVKLNDRMKSRILKCELYLKYTLLTDLMKIVKQYGRKPEFDWEYNYDLNLIKNGDWGEEKAGNDIKKQILAFDGFTTIWLLTLPEKFKEWYDHHLIVKPNEGEVKTAVMLMCEKPSFPPFAKGDTHSVLLPNSENNYTFLPESWNLLTAFEHYLKEEDSWFTTSINNELKLKRNNKSKSKLESKETATMFTLGQHLMDVIELDSNSDQEEKQKEEREKKIEQEENVINTTEKVKDQIDLTEENEEDQEESETENENQEEDNDTEGIRNTKENTDEMNQESHSGQKRRISTSGDTSNTKTMKRKKKTFISSTAAYSTINSMSSKLNHCMTKVVQLETLTDEDDHSELVQELKTNLEALNQEKEIIIKYLVRHAQIPEKMDIAEV